jgi:hypothetical protein
LSRADLEPKRCAGNGQGEEASCLVSIRLGKTQFRKELRWRLIKRIVSELEKKRVQGRGSFRKGGEKSRFVME